MSNSYFEFRQFTICQDQCAMKVGTDGVLLGAWANNPAQIGIPSSGTHILDIGTGTGLIAIMMAQRYANAHVTAIEIDNDAAKQAAINVQSSPFAERITVKHTALQDFNTPDSFDTIVCNPPFFISSLTCPNNQRTISRHTCTLTYDELMNCAYRLLTAEGELSIIIPNDSTAKMNEAATIAGFFAKRICAVKTTERKPAKRFLLSFSKEPQPSIETSNIIIGSEKHKLMTKDFFL